MKKLILIALLTMGCSVNASELSDSYAKDFVKKIKYAKDKRTGICYAIVSARETGTVSTAGIGITVVPCDKCKKVLVN